MITLYVIIRLDDGIGSAAMVLRAWNDLSVFALSTFTKMFIIFVNFFQ
jgi:hypothetical protein